MKTLPTLSADNILSRWHLTYSKVRLVQNVYSLRNFASTKVSCLCLCTSPGIAACKPGTISQKLNLRIYGRPIVALSIFEELGNELQYLFQTDSLPKPHWAIFAENLPPVWRPSHIEADSPWFHFFHLNWSAFQFAISLEIHPNC